MATASATDIATIHKKMFGSCGPSNKTSRMTTLIISNKEMNDIMKKEQRSRFISIVLGTLGAILLENLSTDKGTIRAGEGTIKASQNI